MCFYSVNDVFLFSVWSKKIVRGSKKSQCFKYWAILECTFNQFITVVMLFWIRRSVEEKQEESWKRVRDWSSVIMMKSDKILSIDNYEFHELSCSLWFEISRSNFFSCHGLENVVG